MFWEEWPSNWIIFQLGINLFILFSQLRTNAFNDFEWL